MALTTEEPLAVGQLGDDPETHVVGGQMYIEANTATAAIYLLISGVACIVGTVGNICILCTVFLYKPLRHARNAFVVNLALADLTVTSFADPMGILGMVYGSSWFVQRMALCDLVATVCIAACVTALFSIGGDGFSRFCHICHPDTYHKLFTLRNNIILCVILWCGGIIMSLPALIGWTNNIYDPKYLECIWNRKHSLSYTIFFSAGVVATPVIIIAVSFIKIYVHVQKSRKRVSVCPGAVSCVDSTTAGEADQLKKNRSAAMSIKLARSLFIVFTAFVICWTPYAVIVLVDFDDKLPEELHLFVLLLAHMHSTVNSLIYAMTNAQFRKGYFCILSKIFPCIRGHVKINVEPSFDNKTVHTISN